MSSHTMQAVYLVCDGCQVEHGGDGRFRSAMEARAGSYVDGWRFPAAIKGNGDPSGRSHDVCPACIGSWQPRPFEGVTKQYRQPQTGTLPT